MWCNCFPPPLALLTLLIASSSTRASALTTSGSISPLSKSIVRAHGDNPLGNIPFQDGRTCKSMPQLQTFTARALSCVLRTSRGGSLPDGNADDTAGSVEDASDGVKSLPSPPARLLLGGPPPGLLRRLLPSFPWHRLPDWLTYARCLAIPALALLFDSPDGIYRHTSVGALFALASFTDWLDGYLARRWEITSSFGAFLDPVADKLMVSTALILLSGRYGKVMALPSAIILAREIAVSALREWMAQRGLRDSVKVGYQGKVKTAATMVALTLLLFVPYPGVDGTSSLFYGPGLVLLYFSALITVTSGSVYFKAAAPVLFDKSE